MRSDIQRAALRAAAKLVFSAGVFGCGGASAVDPSAQTDKAPADPASSTEGDLSASRDAGHRAHDAGNVCDPRTHYGLSKDDCCADVVATAYPDGGPSWSQNPAPHVRTEVRQCCQFLADEADAKAKMGQGGFSWPQRDTCCAVIGWTGAATCTPWGPAVPPPMPWAHAASPELQMDVA
jgi:hypothetical protein